jgi:SepF-like predicted cell division protein (DUF552 family)
MVFDNLKKKFMGDEGEVSSEYIEIDLGNESADSKISIKTFVLKVYDDINPILNALREGDNIVVIDIKQLKAKDVVELKRVISKVKKTVEALEGSIAGFGENVVIATPSFARIEKGAQPEKPKNDSNGIERF